MSAVVWLVRLFELYLVLGALFAVPFALRGVLHEVGLASSDRLVFIFVGDLPAPAPLCGSGEGEVGWFDAAALPWDELVPDLVDFLPRMLESDEMLFMTVSYKGDEGAYSFAIS